MGGGTRSYEFARRLVAAGHEVDMITSDQSGASGDWRETVESGIRVHWAAVRYANEMGFARRIAAFLLFAIRSSIRASRIKSDVIFATSTPLTIAIPAMIASWWRRVPFVFEIRDQWPDVPIAIGAIRNPVAKWLARKLELLTYARATRIVALAPGMRDDIVARGVNPAKTVVIPNGCDLDLFAGEDASASPREQHAWLAGRKMVLFAGTLGLVNGVDYLVRVAADALALDPEVRFVVIGGGQQKAAVRELAERLGVYERNFFMLPPVSKREIARWLRAADLIVALFTGPRVIWKDAVQNKFFDALAAGKPVANNFDGWQSRVAAEADIGLMLDPDDTAAAARQIVEVLANDEWLANVPPRARRLAEGRFNRDMLASELESVLTSAADHRRGSTTN